MKKTLVSVLVAMIASTLMACGSAGGPNESDPTAESTAATDVKSATPYYTCSGGHYPCSEAELQSIIASPTYDKKTGQFVSTDGAICTVLCNGGPSNLGCNNNNY